MGKSASKASLPPVWREEHTTSITDTSELHFMKACGRLSGEVRQSVVGRGVGNRQGKEMPTRKNNCMTECVGGRVVSVQCKIEQ